VGREKEENKREEKYALLRGFDEEQLGPMMISAGYL